MMIKYAAQLVVAMEPRTSFEPANARGPRDQLDFRPVLRSQGGSFKRTLPGANDYHRSPGEAAEISMGGGMRDQVGRQRFNLRRAEGEARDAGRQHDAFDDEPFAVPKRQFVAAVLSINQCDP